MDQILANIPYNELLMGFIGLTWKHVVMWAIGATLIVLAVKYDYEPALLLPIGFGAILANIPESSAISKVVGEEGFLQVFIQQVLQMNYSLSLSLLLLVRCATLRR
jgi:carboxybiotin decarboxylase